MQFSWRESSVKSHMSFLLEQGGKGSESMGKYAEPQIANGIHQEV